MTKQTEAMKAALTALKSIDEAMPFPVAKLAQKVIREALAEQPAQQEPIGDDWMPCMKLPVIVHVRKQRKGETHVSTREGITPVKPDDLIMRGVSGEEYPIGRAIFEQTYSFDTSSQPAQRTWVGLTDEDIQEVRENCGITHHAIKTIEAKLMEKNT